jgi:hypothetical protein
MDDRRLGWLFTRLALAVAIVTVVAIPLLAILAPGMTYEGRGGVVARVVYGNAPLIAEAIAIVGLIWMVRIWRDGARDAASAWRSHDREPTTAVDDLHDHWPANDRRLEDPLGPGWLLARIELAVGVVAALVIPIWALFTAPSSDLMGAGDDGPMAALLPYAAEVGILVALAWMVRIWRGPTRELPPAWRYRSR